jgi:hypothetical protein
MDRVNSSLAIGLAFSMAFLLGTAPANAFDESRYPNLKGQWNRIGSPRWDQKDRSGEQAPLTPEYKAIHAANLGDQKAGGQGTDPTYTCLAPGMPRAMVAYEAMEIIVTPETTHLLIDHIHDSRRIYTDGREWPNDSEPTFAGYSIGRWLDENGDDTAAPCRQPDDREGAHLSRSRRSERPA